MPLEVCLTALPCLSGCLRGVAPVIRHRIGTVRLSHAVTHACSAEHEHTCMFTVRCTCFRDQISGPSRPYKLESFLLVIDDLARQAALLWHQHARRTSGWLPNLHAA